MFICAKCIKQSQPGEGSVVRPTTIRPVLYAYNDGRSFMGDEWAKSAIVCQPCAEVEDAILLRTVKTVEVKVQYERTRIQDQEQRLQA